MKRAGLCSGTVFKEHTARGDLREKLIGGKASRWQAGDEGLYRGEDTGKKQGCRYTRRGFCRVFSKEFHGYGVRRLERLIDLAINEGHLVTIESTNSRGVNVEFLSVSETYESG